MEKCWHCNCHKTYIFFFREREEASLLEEVVRKEQERLDGIRKKELARIIHERRRENKQRQTQEIKFN